MRCYVLEHNSRCKDRDIFQNHKPFLTFFHFLQLWHFFWSRNWCKTFSKTFTMRILIFTDNDFLRDSLRMLLFRFSPLPQLFFRSLLGSKSIPHECLSTQADVVIFTHPAPFLNGSFSPKEFSRSVPHRPKIFLLALSRSEERTLQMLQTGIDQYLCLPLSPHRFLRKIEEATQCFPQHQAL